MLSKTNWKRIKDTVYWNNKVPDIHNLVFPIHSSTTYSAGTFETPYDLDKSDEITPDEKDVDDDAENSDGQHNSPNGEDNWTKKIMKLSNLEFKKKQFPYL